MVFEIPIEPKTKKNHSRIIRKKNSNGGFIPILIPSEAFLKYEKECKPYIPKIDTPIDYPINLKCSFFLKTRRKTDLTNLLQAICDILVDYKVISDDNYFIVSSFDGTFASYDKENPRTIVEITKREVN